jgi:hypothetical protein
MNICIVFIPEYFFTIYKKIPCISIAPNRNMLRTEYKTIFCGLAGLDFSHVRWTTMESDGTHSVHQSSSSSLLDDEEESLLTVSESSDEVLPPLPLLLLLKLELLLLSFRAGLSSTTLASSSASFLFWSLVVCGRSIRDWRG